MSPSSSRPRFSKWVSTTYTSVLDHLNFYRVHLLCFTFIPLILSSVMYGVSTAYSISFIDCLFCCVSAMTVTGLATINLSTLSAVQQVILFFHMICGSMTFVSIIIVCVRLHAFRQKFKHVIHERRKVDDERSRGFNISRTISRVNPVQALKELGSKVNNGVASSSEKPKGDVDEDSSPTTSSEEDTGHDTSPSKTPYASRAVEEDMFPRTRTIAFEEEDIAGGSHAFTTAREGVVPTARSNTVRSSDLPQSTIESNGFPRTYSLRPSETRTKVESRLSGFGGFPTPWEIARGLFEKAFPERADSLRRTMSLAQTTTIGRSETGKEKEKEKEKDTPYISFAAVIGRNSQFEGLTEDQMDELGGVEYRALRVLLWIVIGYFLFLQIACFIIFTPYLMAGGRYDAVFNAQPQLVHIPWFSLFQAVSAFTNTGMSLSDTSVIPFQEAYLMTTLTIILIFAGNTAYPVFLRLTVWSIYKLVPRASRVRESLKFLLDHPRRCFVYMFPAHQTWVLASVMTALYLIDFVSFLVLDIGTDAIDSIPVGTRIAASFFQSAAVRNAGFAIVPLAALAPAVKVLYVIFMYISVYPIALSVRATNVYEEKSLGLYGDDNSKDDDEVYNQKGAHAVAKYVGWHARRQLAFDVWWLALALWLICIIERGNIINAENASYFNIFNILFEVVSAYGTVGLSLGVPYDNYSFSGAWSTLSKLVIVFVMLRGRHRGLPVAIDRAVMLPKDFTVEDEEILDRARSRRLSRQASSLVGVVR